MLNPIRHLLALVGARHIVHVSGIRVNLLVVEAFSVYEKFCGNDLSKSIFYLSGTLAKTAKSDY